MGLPQGVKGPKTCTEPDCDNPHLSRGLCNKHYSRRRRTGDLPPRIREGGVCTADDCERQSVSRGRCEPHYRAWLRDGGLASCRLPDCDGGVWAHGLCMPHAARRRRYGLSDEDLVLIDARDRCDICSNAPEVVDHDHTTGEVRGVLCRNCNTALGLFADSTPALAAALRYLTSPPGV